MRGLPEQLPVGEIVVWQGAPAASALAHRTFHIRKVAMYFLLLVAWRIGAIFAGSASLETAAISLLWMVPLALAAIGVLVLLAGLISRTTIYTITNQRLVMRFGIALPMSINIPFRVINTVALRSYPDGSGDIPLSLGTGERISYLVLWPHVRPWRIARAEPMLRCVPNARTVARILARAMAAAAALPDPEPREMVASPTADMRPRTAAAA
jgi:Bacterial PH domain